MPSASAWVRRGVEMCAFCFCGNTYPAFSVSGIPPQQFLTLMSLWMTQVSIGPAVGEGAFSTVYIGKYFGDIVAVKKQTRQVREDQNCLLRAKDPMQYLSSLREE